MKYISKLSLFSLLTVFIAYANAQQVVSSAGANYSNSQGSLSVTIGEPVTQTVSNVSINFILTQGFQQSNVSTTVPLRLIEFSGVRTNVEAKLKWKVANEVNIASYTLQRSYNGTNFTDIGSVISFNNGALENNYNYTDVNAGKSTVYYKLIIKEKDGSVSYSWIVSITGDNEQIRIYPMPVTKSFTIDVSTNEASQKKLQLFDVTGKMVWSQNYSLVIGRNILNIDISNLASGTYVLTGLNEKSVKIIKE